MTEMLSKSVMQYFDPKYTIGFDRLMDDWAKTLAGSNTTNFPPYNIIKKDDKTILEFALAGYSKNDVSIVQEGNRLTISGKKEDSEEDYTFKGIAYRAFTKTFILGEHTKVSNASFKDGLLRVEVELVIPEEKKPKQIPIF